MHELGVMIEVVKTVESFARQNNIKKIDMLVLQVGELASVIPRYIESCYPAAADGTMLEETELRIEILPGNARCKACGHVFNLLQSGNICPECGHDHWELLGGREFLIKQIVAC